MHICNTGLALSGTRLLAFLLACGKLRHDDFGRGRLQTFCKGVSVRRAEMTENSVIPDARDLRRSVSFGTVSERQRS